MKGPESFPFGELNEKSLPEINLEAIPKKLKTNPNSSMRIEHFLIKDEKGEPIGRVELNIQKNPKTGDARAHLSTINIQDNLRGRGLGRATYLKIIDRLKSEGIVFVSGGMLSDDAQKVWKWLEANGKARLVGSDKTAEQAYEAV